MKRLVIVAAFGSLGAALACGPSFQAVYEGNAQFEHCYALEERPQTAVQQKAECWHDWSSRYTYGQTRDRIHYATARYVALSQSNPTDEALMMAAPGMTVRTSTITAPTPTNAFAPPPKVLVQADAAPEKVGRPSDVSTVVGIGGSSRDDGAGAPDASANPVRVPLPSSGCVDECTATFRTCKGAGCEGSYRSCMRVCMK